MINKYILKSGFIFALGTGVSFLIGSESGILQSIGFIQATLLNQLSSIIL